MEMIKHRVAREGYKWIVLAGNVIVQEFNTRDEARIFAGKKPSHRTTPLKQQDDARTAE